MLIDLFVFITNIIFLNIKYELTFEDKFIDIDLRSEQRFINPKCRFVKFQTWYTTLHFDLRYKHKTRHYFPLTLYHKSTKRK